MWSPSYTRGSAQSLLSIVGRRPFLSTKMTVLTKYNRYARIREEEGGDIWASEIDAFVSIGLEGTRACETWLFFLQKDACCAVLPCLSLSSLSAIMHVSKPDKCHTITTSKKRKEKCRLIKYGEHLQFMGIQTLKKYRDASLNFSANFIFVNGVNAYH